MDRLLELVTERLGLRVEETALPPGLGGLLIDGTILLAADLGAADRRWVWAHELGHAVLHAGDERCLDAVATARWERQAELFAGALLLGWPVRGEPWELAEDHGLPGEKVAAWLRQAGQVLGAI